MLWNARAGNPLPDPDVACFVCAAVHECACVPFDLSDPARGAWPSPVNLPWMPSATTQDGFNRLARNLFNQHTLVCEAICGVLGSRSLDWWGILFASCFCFVSDRAEVTTAGDTIYYVNCSAKVPSEQRSIQSIFNVGGIIKRLKQCMLGIGGRFYLLCGLKVFQSRGTRSGNGRFYKCSKIEPTQEFRRFARSDFGEILTFFSADPLRLHQVDIRSF